MVLAHSSLYFLIYRHGTPFLSRLASLIMNLSLQVMVRLFHESQGGKMRSIVSHTIGS